MLMKNHSVSLVVAAIAIAILLPQSVYAACGEVLVSKGDVKIENGKDKSVKSAPQGTKVCQGDTVIAGTQSRAKVKMEDGNELNISPDSRILLETYEYKAADNKKKVLLNVLYGKVRAATREENMYNDKTKDGQANTFQVKTKSAVAGVRGTDFVTSFDRKTSKTEIVTFKGKVDVGTPGPGGAILNPVSVGAGQKTEALLGAPPAPPKPVSAGEMDRMNKETRGGNPDSAGGKNNENQPIQSNRDGDKDNNERDPSSGNPDRADREPEKGPDKKGPERRPEAGSGRNSDKAPDRGSNSGIPGGGAAGGFVGDVGDDDVGDSVGGSVGNTSGETAGGPAPGMAPPPGPGGLPPMGDGSMISREDMGMAPVRGPAGLPDAPMMMMPPPPPPIPILPPVNPLVNQVVESGPGKVNITIAIPQ